MSVYVRLGIRLLYKGLKSRRMEKDKSKSRHPTTPVLELTEWQMLSSCYNNVDVILTIV